MHQVMVMVKVQTEADGVLPVSPVRIEAVPISETGGQ